MNLEELRAALLDLYADESLVDEFLDTVNAANRTATTRIARATAPVEETTDETPGEESVEPEAEVVEEVERSVETVEVEEEEAVEAEEVEVEEETVIELDETFVSDLVASDAFAEVLERSVAKLIDKKIEEVNLKIRALEEAETEWVQDTPARTKKAVVSFRPRAVNPVAVAGDEGGTRSLQDIAKANINEIFGEG